MHPSQVPGLLEQREGEMLCPCHHGVFDAKTGVPTAGPPKRPSPEIRLTIEQGEIFATGVKRYEA
ncbi:Rieske 2Fe-2S domain-containing protein [Paenibacillus sp. P26]|nr:Rieske 2Fe-2S domain-containing protein [Paenibacillus sp. P26]UUZ96608.1 Rieske 2Fe-2S domain-containing protein [Paenibacillus sp. P25]